MARNSKGYVTLLILSVIYIAKPVHGADPFESGFGRLRCFIEYQPDCNEDFTDIYKNLSWSVTNLTKADTYWYMFTNDNPEVPELMHKCGGRLPPSTTFNPSCPTEIYIPGFFSGPCNYAIFRQLKNERLKSGCYNVILLDWMWGNIPDLVVAKLNMFIVANQTSIVIENLKEYYRSHGQSEDDKFILSGHSYGAHLAGLIGQLTTIAVINGIEPSGGTISENTPLNERLDPKDAKCVQVLHCNFGQCIPFYFGVNFTCGTIDVFYNDGLNQPSCYKSMFIALLTGDYVYGLLHLIPGACNHFECLEYFKATMNPTDCQPVAVECKNHLRFKLGFCDDCGPNGENCVLPGAYGCECLKDGQSGNYYLETKFNCPYCTNEGIDTSNLFCPAGKFPPPDQSDDQGLLSNIL